MAAYFLISQTSLAFCSVFNGNLSYQRGVQRWSTVTLPVYPFSSHDNDAIDNDDDDDDDGWGALMGCAFEAITFVKRFANGEVKARVKLNKLLLCIQVI